VAYTAGCFSRVTSVLTLLAVLSYIHRGPMLAGPMEVVLAMLLVYLCLAPTGAAYAWDVRRQAEPPGRSVMANLSQRLIQLHLAGLYLMTGLNMLAGETWWSGDAVWWLLAHSESRLIDLTFLGRSQGGRYLLNLTTHLTAAFFLLFGLLCWSRLARPLLLLAGLCVWTFIGMVTGQLAYALLMMALSFAAWRNSSAEVQSNRMPLPS
jgi:hypothetical protein